MIKITDKRMQLNKEQIIKVHKNLQFRGKNLMINVEKAHGIERKTPSIFFFFFAFKLTLS